MLQYFFVRSYSVISDSLYVYYDYLVKFRALFYRRFIIIITMATIESLSYEILIMILEKISIKDIENFSSTCKKFKQTSWGDKLWMKKLYQKWPRTRIICDSMTSEEKIIKDYKAVVKCVKEMYNLISEIPKDNLSETNKKKSMLKFLDKTRNDTIYQIVTYELEGIMRQHPRTIGCDLTQRYYSYYIFRQLKYYHLKHSILKFRSRHRYHQLLEEMIILLVQWFNIDRIIYYSDTKTFLDNIAKEILQDLREKHPLHSIFAMSDEYFNHWRNYNTFHTYWHYEEMKTILIAIKEFLSDRSNYGRIYQELWINLNPHVGDEVEFIVLRRKEIFFLAIYHAILRRVGIHSVVNFNGFELQIFLKSNLEYFYVRHKDGRFDIDDRIRRYDRIRRDVPIRSYIGIEFIFDPNIFNLSINVPLNVLQVEPTLLKFWSSESIQDLQHTWETDQDVTYPDILNIKWESISSKIIKRSKPERRSAELKFVIGTIVNHKCNDDTNRIHCGVIVGWHYYFNGLPFKIFNRPNIIKFCKYKNCTDSTCLTHKPYYIIFCDNNEYCYVRQENILIFSSPPFIVHDEIGRYFSKLFFCERPYYVPNEMLARYYPCDVAIINEMMHN
ncbi:uncharacterized protein LOC115242921 [Formica exsecta]|uniref:uncharacterized protein LOC115242921 n=1 Tax=Formica exsecta TaxID=72781 RepID=UPI0011418814|nr:uncharacterized protein LOC115242921 [Formica exsecta]